MCCTKCAVGCRGNILRAWSAMVRIFCTAFHFLSGLLQAKSCIFFKKTNQHIHTAFRCARATMWKLLIRSPLCSGTNGMETLIALLQLLPCSARISGATPRTTSHVLTISKKALDVTLNLKHPSNIHTVQGACRRSNGRVLLRLCSTPRLSTLSQH